MLSVYYYSLFCRGLLFLDSFIIIILNPGMYISLYLILCYLYSLWMSSIIMTYVMTL